MARKPQPGGDRNAWGVVMNDYLEVSHNPDGTIKPAGVQTAVATEVETALSVQVPPAVADAVAADSTVAAAAAAAIDAEPRVSQLVTDVDAASTAIARVDPGITGTTSQQLRVSVSGPRWLEPNTVSPLLFDAVGDGVADDYAKLMLAIEGAATNAATLSLEGRTFKSNTPITLTGKISIDGGSMGTNSSGTPQGGGFIFPAGSDGLIVRSEQFPRLENMFIRTTVPYGVDPTILTGTGVLLQSYSPSLRGLHIHGFGQDGISINAGAPDNAYNGNHAHITTVRSSYNGRHGLHIRGNDSNVGVYDSINTTGNLGYGIFNDGMYNNTFINPHAAFNHGGDFYDDAWGSYWINPYSELYGDFVVGPGSQGGTLLMSVQGSPKVADITVAIARGWFIQKGPRVLSLLSHETVGGEVWSWKPQNPGTNDLSLIADTAGVRLLTFTPNDGGRLTVNADRLGFYDATPAVKPTVTGAKGGNAALTSLITALKNLGLITDSTT